MMRRSCALLLTAALGGAIAAAGCRSAAPSPVVGTWTCDCERGGTLHLRPDGTALWVIGTGETAEAYEVRYRWDPAPEPDHLDLFGFERGALQELTLYGIAELTDAATLRLDVEPGSSDAGGAAARPRTFTDQTVTYHRR